MCGYNSSGIQNCYNTGTVSGSSEVGGVCGCNECTIATCYNTGTVSGSNNVGGVCGYNRSGEIKNCYNTGLVSGSGSFVGGVCGYNNSDEIENCYYNTEICQGEKAVGYGSTGTNVKGLTTTQMTGERDDDESNTAFQRAQQSMVGFSEGGSVWSFKEDDKKDGKKYAYYPHLKEFTNSEDWPPKVELSGKVTFDANDGTKPSSTFTQQFYKNIDSQLRKNTFSREGYIFYNWNTESNGTVGTAYDAAAVTNFSADTTLYAQWSPQGSINISGNSWEEIISKITFGLFFKDSLDVTINAADESNTVIEKRYYIADKSNNSLSTAEEIENAVTINGGWTDYKKTFKIDVLGQKVIYAKLVYNSAVTYLSSNGLVIYSDTELKSQNPITVIEGKEDDLDIELELHDNTIDSVKMGNTSLLVDSDYIIKEDGITLKGSYLRGLSVDDHKLTISYNPQGVQYEEGKGDEPATTEITVQVKKKELIGGDFDIGNENVVYNGQQQDANVKLNGNDLPSNMTVFYKKDDNEITPIDAGEYKVFVKIEGDNDYAMVKELFVGYFTITAKAITNDMIDPIPNQFLSGTEVKPTIVVRHGQKILVEDTDYTVAYTRNQDLGTATAIVEGLGNYQSKVEKEFNIVNKEIEKDMITGVPSSVAYTGDEIRPEIIVKYDGTNRLEEGTDYTVKYENNKDVGTATIVVEGIGNYAGVHEFNFTITLADLTASVTQSGRLVYNGEEQIASVTTATTTSVKDAIVTFKYSKTKDGLYETDIPTFVDAGEYEVFYIATAANHKDATGSFIVKIDGASLTNVSVMQLESLTYNGDDQRAVVKATADSVNNVPVTFMYRATETEEYKSSVPSFREAGTHIVYYKASAANHKDATGSFIVKIDGALLTNVSVMQLESLIYNGDDQRAVVKATADSVNNVPVTFMYRATETEEYKSSVPSFREAGTHIVYYKASAANHTDVVDSFEVTIGKIETGKSQFKYAITSTEYTGNEQGVNVTFEGNSQANQVLNVYYKEKNGNSYANTKTDPTKAGTYGVFVNFKGNSNYEEVNDLLIGDFEITAKSIKDVVIEPISNQKYTGKEIRPTVTVKDGETTLKQGTDYDVAYENNQNVGTATAIVTGIGNYTSEVIKEFTIVTKEIEKSMITVNLDSVVYTGYEIEPTVNVKDDEKKLEEGIDYTVKYENNKDVGTAIITVEGIGDYAGINEFEFEITSAELKNVSVTQSNDLTYNGEGQRASVTVAVTTVDDTDDKVNFKYSKDENGSYTDSVPAFTDAGTYTVYYKASAANHKDATGYFTVTIDRAKVDKSYFKYTITSVEYTGKVQGTSVTFKGNSQENQDLTVYYKVKTGDTYADVETNPTNAGIYGVFVSFKENSNYVDVDKLLIGDFEITAKSITGEMIDSISNQVYTGEDIKPEVNVKDRETILAKGTDYTVAYENNQNVGTATVKVTGIGNYKETVEKTFEIIAKPITGDMITPISAQTYTGSDIKPEVIVKDGETSLTEGDDYTVEYKNNQNVGTATAIVTGKGNYKETVEKTFEIIAKSITDDMIDPIPNQMYTGSNIEPKVIVKDGEIILKKDVDYTVEYRNNQNVGTATAIVTGIDNYKSKVEREFDIVNQKIEKSMITVNLDSVVYTGYEIEPTVNVKDDGKKLEEGTDYTVKYENNKYVGIAIITVEGIGDYAGINQIEFKITPAELTNVSVTQSNDLTYNGEEQRASVTVVATTVDDTDDKVNFKYSKDKNGTYTDSVPTFTDAGTYTVYYKASTVNHKDATGSFEVTIDSAELTNVSVTQSNDLTYNGEEQRASVIVAATTVDDTDDKVNFKYSKDKNGTYTDSVPTFTDAGTYTVYYKASTVNHKDATGSFEVTIDSAELTNVSVTQSNDLTYNGEEQRASVIVAATTVDDTDDKVNFKYSKDENGSYTNSVPTFTDVGTYTVYYKASATNHKDATGFFKVTIDKAQLTDIKVEQLSFPTYDGKEQSVEVEAKANAVGYILAMFTYSTEELGTYESRVPSFKNAGNHTVYYKASAANHEEARGSFDIIIGKAKTSEITVNGIVNQQYKSGKEIEQDNLSLSINGTVIPKEDYEVKYENNKNVGTAKLTITSNNFDGIIEKEFRITEKSIDDCEFFKIEKQAYTGLEIEPEVVVKDGEKFLEKDKDYEISYKNNKDMGTATVIVKGIGEYAGEKELNFEITKATLNMRSFGYSNPSFGQSIREILDDYEVSGINGEEISGKWMYVDSNGNEFDPDEVKLSENDKTIYTAKFVPDDEKYDSISINICANPVYRDTEKLKKSEEQPLEEFTNQVIVNVVFPDGSTGVYIDRYGIIWTMEMSGGVVTMYAVDNSEGVFELGSMLYVRWLNNQENPEAFSRFEAMLDDEHKKAAEEGKLWIFEVVVESPEGIKYTKLSFPVAFFIQLGEDWDIDDVKTVFISTGEDELQELKGIETMKTSNGENYSFAVVMLKHFSPYAVYDEDIPRDEDVPGNDDTPINNDDTPINNDDTDKTTSEPDEIDLTESENDSVRTGDPIGYNLLVSLAILLFVSGFSLVGIGKRKKR